MLKEWRRRTMLKGSSFWNERSGVGGGGRGSEGRVEAIARSGAGGCLARRHPKAHPVELGPMPRCQYGPRCRRMETQRITAAIAVIGAPLSASPCRPGLKATHGHAERVTRLRAGTSKMRRCNRTLAEARLQSILLISPQSYLQTTPRDVLHLLGRLLCWLRTIASVLTPDRSHDVNTIYVLQPSATVSSATVPCQGELLSGRNSL